MQLTLLVTSPRVAPGLMSWPAWQAVAAATRRWASSEQMPVVRAVRAAGHTVEVRAIPSAEELLAAAGSADLVWLASDEEATTLPAGLAAAIVGAAEAGREAPEVEVLHASYDVPGARLLDLVTVMDRLRRECPWDRRQTHRSLARYLLEESYETLEAIETGDLRHLREELGDLLLQVYFHARIAAEGGDSQDDAFDIDDVAGAIVEKLVRRHPHVFARSEGDEAVSVADVEESWETLKAAEKQRASVLEGIPWSLPALSLADKVLSRAAGVSAGRETEHGAAADEAGRVGEALLDLVAQARAQEVDPEQALRDAVRRLAESVREAESR